MKPVELFDLCMDAVDRFNRGEVLAEKPFIMLTLPRPGKTCGRTIRLFGNGSFADTFPWDTLPLPYLKKVGAR